VSRSRNHLLELPGFFLVHEDKHDRGFARKHLGPENKSRNSDSGFALIDKLLDRVAFAVQRSIGLHGYLGMKV
jgi:hypothetical protein